MKIDTDTEEGKAELQKLIDAQTAGLKSKNEELLGDQKKLKADMKTFQDKLDSITREKDEAEAAAATKSGDIETIKANLTKAHTKEKETLTTERDSLKGQLNQVLIDKGLTEALVAANVAPQHMKAVTAMIKAEAKGEIVTENDTPIAKFNGKTIKDYVSDWSQSDEGKHYVAAQQNGGGGAGGSNGGSKATNVKSDMGGTPEQRAAAIQSRFTDLPK